MLEVKLTPDLDTALSRVARRARKSKASLVLDAVAQYLRDADDYQAVLESRKRRGRTATLAQVKQRLGLGRRDSPRLQKSSSPGSTGRYSAEY